MDYLTLGKCKVGYEHILVITDHFTRYAVAEPTLSQIQEQKDDNQDVNDDDSEILLIASRVNPDVSDTTKDENKENDESSTIEGTETSSSTTELESLKIQLLI